MPVKDYNKEASLNVSISGINIAEGCAPSGINDAIRQLMADVKEESEAQAEAVAEAESAASSQVSSLNSTLRAFIAQEVAKYLPLSGGKLTGRLTGVYYDQICSGLDHTVLPSTNAYGSSLRFLDKNSTPFASLNPIRRSTGENILRLSVLKADGVNGTHLDIQQKDGVASMLLAGASVLTSAGGTVTGTLSFGESHNVINKNSDDSVLRIIGGRGYPSNPFLELHGGSVTSMPGVFVLSARTSDSNKRDLIGYPSGDLTWRGSSVLTSAGGLLMNRSNVVAGSVAGGSYTLPSGGTWAYIFMRGQYEGNAVASGVAAGGTTVSTGDNGTHAYFAVRVA
ncbi:hypothetical protein [Mailhella sp.]